VSATVNETLAVVEKGWKEILHVFDVERTKALLVLILDYVWVPLMLIQELNRC
jgi:hypothetical protein